MFTLRWETLTIFSDEDECEYEGMCSYPHSVCVNLPGTFKCVCEEGYEGDHSECERTFDDTECKSTSSFIFYDTECKATSSFILPQ